MFRVDCYGPKNASLLVEDAEQARIVVLNINRQYKTREYRFDIVHDSIKPIVPIDCVIDLRGAGQ